MSATVLPRLIAHRGMPRRHRENTLPGFLAASAAGADGWELDVHASRDGVVVVHHDPILPAWAGPMAGVGIASMDWSALAEATIGEAGERLSTLDAVLTAAGAGTEVFVEIKARGIETAVLETLAAHREVPTAVHSFDHRVSARARAISPDTPTGILLDSYLMDPAHAFVTAGARDYWPHREMVDRALVETIHAVGGRVVVWTVNDVAQARHLAELGVDALCTDIVDELRAALMA